MPWTLVHPAAVLPLKRPRFARLPFDALVIGSMSPDFGYYVGAFQFAARAHTASGILLICLPLSLVVHLLVRPLYARLIALLPAPHRQALEDITPRPLNSTAAVLLAALAIVIGAATHNAWDSFTHNNGATVARFHWLRRPIFSLGGHVFAVCELLQHASTLLGAVLLVVAYRRWLAARVAAPAARVDLQESRRRWVLLALLMLALSAAGVFEVALLSGRDAHASWIVELVRFVIATTTAFTVFLIAAALTLGRGPAYASR